MASIRQYPHYLFVERGTASVQNADGDWTDSTATRQFVSVCREETNGKGSEIFVAGGTCRKFAALVQIPKGAAHINDGEKVFVCNDSLGNDVRLEGVCLKYDEGQLHNRLWV